MWNPIAERNLPVILRISGAGTMGAGLLFLAPATVLGMIGVTVGDDAGMFFVRHWGLLAACIGALLFYSAASPALRVPVMAAASVEKLALLAMLAQGAHNPALTGLQSAAGFDILCVLLFVPVLWRNWRPV